MFAKGHGTQNDFVLLPDLDGRLALTPAAVAALCDRRRGTRGRRRAAGDHRGCGRGCGCLRPAARRRGGRRLVHGLPQRRRLDRADVRQRCPGVRPLSAGQRAGEPRRVRRRLAGGPAAGGAAPAGTPPTPTSPSRWARPTSSAPVRRSSAARPFAGLAVDVGNPHLACVDPGLTAAELAALDVAAPVQFDSAQFPDGVNVEVLTAPSNGSVSMRVHERGVGETRSCGTGTVAAAVAALAYQGATPGRWRCESPAGRSPSRSPTPAATCAARRCWWPAARSPRNGGVRSSD